MDVAIVAVTIVIVSECILAEVHALERGCVVDFHTLPARKLVA